MQETNILKKEKNKDKNNLIQHGGEYHKHLKAFVEITEINSSDFNYSKLNLVVAKDNDSSNTVHKNIKYKGGLKIVVKSNNQDLAESSLFLCPTGITGDCNGINTGYFLDNLKNMIIIYISNHTFNLKFDCELKELSNSNTVAKTHNCKLLLSGKDTLNYREFTNNEKLNNDEIGTVGLFKVLNKEIPTSTCFINPDKDVKMINNIIEKTRLLAEKIQFNLDINK